MHQGISTAVDKVSLGNSSVGKSLPTPCFTKVCTLWVLSSYISTSVSNRYVSLFVFMTLCLRVSPVRLAEYRWRPLFNAAKFGWRPLYQMPCQDAKPVEIYRGAPNSGTDLSRSSPYYDDMWRRYCSLTSFFFRLSIHALVAKIQPDKVVRWCLEMAIIGEHCVLYFSEPRAVHFRPAF